MSTPETPTPQPAGPTTAEELVANGYTTEQAELLVKIDAALAGSDASLAIPLMLMVVENISGMLLPDAQRAVSQILSETAFRIGQAAAEAAKAITDSHNEGEDDEEQTQETRH